MLENVFTGCVFFSPDEGLLIFYDLQIASLQDQIQECGKTL